MNLRRWTHRWQFAECLTEQSWTSRLQLRFRAYIQRIEAVAGHGGHNATFRAACKLRDAGLSAEEALAVLEHWNATNAKPPWSTAELRHKILSVYGPPTHREVILDLRSSDGL